MSNPNRKDENIRRANRVIQTRSFVLMLLMGVGMFVLLFFRLFDLQIVRHEELQSKAVSQQPRRTVVTASRGTIYDRTGNIMAISASAETIILSPLEIDRAVNDKDAPVSWTKDTLAAGLAELLDGDAAAIRKRMDNTKSQYEVIKLRAEEDTANAVRAYINENKIVGVHLVADAKRYYPYGSLASHVIGFVGDDNTGLYGLEARYEQELEGQSGMVVSTKDNAGNDMMYAYEQYFAAQNGSDLTLTLDTGGYPPEELSELYRSMLLRRKYHRLPDGRYLELNGSSCEKLAEMAQMLQLTGRELARGKATLPAYRALYLDELLSGSDGIQVSRDSQLRSMIRNFKTLSESDYALPSGLNAQLRSYQQIGYQWLKTLEGYGFGGILADEMGLGKALQMIAFLATVPQKTAGVPNLVICPASLIYNWGDELQKFAPQLRYQLILGNAAERERLRAAGAECDVWVTSYELVRQDIEAYAKLQFYCCVLDEAQHIKNAATLASKAVKRLSCRQRFVLTGTPIENRLSELWNLFDFLMPGYLYTNHAFREKLEKPILKSKNPDAVSQLRRLVQPFLLRRLKKDVLKELPPKEEYVRKISLSEDEQKLYYACVQAAVADLGDEQGKLQILAALTRLRQVCCDPGLCFENYEGPTSKLDACVELCEAMAENGHQILLFSQFTSMLDQPRERLDALHISNFTLQGSTPKEKRAAMVKAFNAGSASVFLISLKAGGMGLNLTAADIVIHFDPWWNQAAQNQATDRAHRIGQQAHVQVYKLIAKDTIEERILELQNRKLALLDTISGCEEAGILNMSSEELLSLLKS